MSLNETLNRRQVAKTLRKNADAGKKGIGVVVYQNSGVPSVKRPEQGVEIFTTRKEVE